MRIGVDVGGTNTDAVLIDGDRVLASCKKQTSENVSDGVVQAITSVLQSSGVTPDKIQCVMIGTTHFTNAFVERKNLMDVGIIRVCLPAAKGIPPLIDWPEDLLSEIGNHRYMIEGGYQFDGRLNSKLDEQAVVTAARDLKAKGIRTVAISSLFSQVNSDMEERAKDIVQKEMGEVPITLSHKVGRAGLLERENASIMNASLADLSVQVVNSFRNALAELNLVAPFYISQNDGTLMPSDYIEQYPVLTFSSGPTNSMRGAAYLSGVKDAIVADIGGTTTDVGMLTGGFPRESSLTVDIGGVRTNFRMPDVLALGLGGGSLVHFTEQGLGIGPRSVGYRLPEESLIFGGDTLTASDLAVAAGYADFGDRACISHLDKNFIKGGIDKIHAMIGEGVDRMKTSSEPMPLILVGGGSILIGREIVGVSEVIVPEYAEVANAIGASIAQVGGEVDTVVAYDKVGRDAALDQVKQQAVKLAVDAGANEDSIEVLDVNEVPLAYAPDGAVRLRVKVAGDLQLAAGSSCDS